MQHVEIKVTFTFSRKLRKLPKLRKTTDLKTMQAVSPTETDLTIDIEKLRWDKDKKKYYYTDAYKKRRMDEFEANLRWEEDNRLKIEEELRSPKRYYYTAPDASYGCG